jgi:benzoate membrane transport protein
MVLWERETHFWRSVRDLRRAVTLSSASAGLVAALLGVTGPTLLVYQAALNAHFSSEQIGSWFFAIFGMSGLFSVWLALAYRQPICGAYSIAGAALLLQTLPHFTLAQAVGAYVLSALLITLLALTGWFERGMRLIPAPIIMAMLAGILLRFATEILHELLRDPWLVGGVVLAYVLAQRQARRFPPVTVALAVGVVLALWLHPLPAESIPLRFTLPSFYAPAFSLDAFLSLTLPLTLLTLSSQNATGIGVLWALGYRAPVHAITLATGLFSLVTAPMAGHGVNLATPMTAICGDAGAHPDPDLRWGAAVVNGVLFSTFGVLGLTLLALIRVLPLGLITTVAGLALVPVIIQSLEKSFGSGQHRLGCLFALVIAASNIQFLGIGAAFWSLVGALVISFVADADWRRGGAA